MIINFDNIGSGSGSGGTGSVVSWRQDLSAGTQIANITINGNSQAVYAPEGGSAGGMDIYYVNEVTGNTALAEELFNRAKACFVSGSDIDFRVVYSGNTYDAEPFLSEMGAVEIIENTISFDGTFIPYPARGYNYSPSYWYLSINGADNFSCSFGVNGGFAAPAEYNIEVINPALEGGLVFDRLNGDYFTNGDGTVIYNYGQVYEGLLKDVIYLIADGNPAFMRFCNLAFKVIEYSGKETKYINPIVKVFGIDDIEINGHIFNRQIELDYGTVSVKFLGDGGTTVANLEYRTNTIPRLNRVSYNGSVEYNAATSALTWNGQAISVGTNQEDMINYGMLDFSRKVEPMDDSWFFSCFRITVTESDGSTEYSLPSIGLKTLSSSVTVGDTTYDYIAIFDYGEWVFRFYVDTQGHSSYIGTQKR